MTRWPNGLDSTRCSDFLPTKLTFELRLQNVRSPFPGNRILRPETKPPESEPKAQLPILETERLHGSLPIRGYSRVFRKSPHFADCVVGPGGFEPPTRPCLGIKIASPIARRDRRLRYHVMRGLTALTRI